jgi:hypothetical protein
LDIQEAFLYVQRPAGLERRRAGQSGSSKTSEFYQLRPIDETLAGADN